MFSINQILIYLINNNTIDFHVMKQLYCKGEMGSPIDFVFTKEEAYILKVIQSLVNYKPKEVNPILFDHLNSDYMLQASWILKWQVKSLERVCDRYSSLMLQGAEPRAVLMINRLNICFRLFELMDFPLYFDAWEFWLNVEMDWKKTVFEATNKSAVNQCNTKQKISSVNRKYKQLIKDKKNPYEKSKNPHLFIMIDASLNVIGSNYKKSDLDFLKEYWNPFVNAVKDWFNIDDKNTQAWNLSPDGKTLLASTGGRKKEMIYQSPLAKFSGRGRKKEERKIYDTNDFLSFDIPETFGDLSYLDISKLNELSL